MGPEVRWSPRSARCWRCRRRWPRPASSRRSASPSSAGRASPAAARRAETDRFSLAAMFVLAAPVPARRHPAGLLHRRAGAGRRRAWSAAACRRRPRSPGSRSCRSPRAAVPITACWSSSSSRSRRSLAAVVDPSLRLARAAPRAGLGLRLSRSEPADAIHRRQLRPADPPGVRRPSCSARASTSTCRRPATCGRRASTSTLHDLVWDCLYAPIAGAVELRRRPSQPSAVPDHPPLSQPRLRRARRPACWCWRYGADPRPRHPGRADAAGAGCWRRC